MTFTQRRRLIRFFWYFCENSYIPFVLGFVFCLFVFTHELTSIFENIDKSGFDLCLNSQVDQKLLCPLSQQYDAASGLCVSSVQGGAL